MANITPQEQYEVIRIIHESKADVTICLHDSTNKYINILLKKMNVTLKSCSTERLEHQQFHLQKECSPSSQ
jgi:hypothetical protein